MNKSELKAIFINAKATDAKYIGVSIQTEGSSQPEIIINPNPNFDANGERERLMIIQDRCMKQCRQGASDFGLTVSSRCRLVVPKPQQQKPENKFAKYAN